MNNNWNLGVVLVFAALWIASFFAYVTHLAWSFGLLFHDQVITTAQAILVVLGIFVAPVGVIHGFYLWFA